MTLTAPAPASTTPDEESFPVRNPATGEEIGRVRDFGVAGATRAIESAAAAFPAWAARPAEERSDILHAAYRLLMEQADELARTLTLENGKPLAESKGEVAVGARMIQWAAEEAKRVYGRTIPATLADRRYLAIKQPVGVVAAITPWNFPFSMITRKAGPALAAGCTVVLRPASATPLSAVAIEANLHQAGVPTDVFRVVTTRQSAPIGELFATHPLVKKITFTGSTEVGKALLRMAAGSVKRTSMELGGHAPFLVFADAELDKAADGVIASKFRNSGQTCICTNRLYVERTVADQFAAKVAERARGLKVGNGLDQGVQIGPLIDRPALEKVEVHVKDALDRGATLLAGGKRAQPDGLSGAFYEPTVLGNVPADARVVHEETFGPLLPVIPFDSEQEAITAANDTPYGLAAYAFTRDVGRVFRVAEGLEYGIVGVNDPVPSNYPLPFGGVKESGMGRENGAEAIEAFLETKAVAIGL